jgi:uncharacterized ubiquitin-like protein YukD
MIRKLNESMTYQRMYNIVESDKDEIRNFLDYILENANRIKEQDREMVAIGVDNAWKIISGVLDKLDYLEKI